VLQVQKSTKPEPSDFRIGSVALGLVRTVATRRERDTLQDLRRIDASTRFTLVHGFEPHHHRRLKIAKLPPVSTSSRYPAMDEPYSRLPVPSLSLFDNASLFLDFDGTLVDLAASPGAVVADDHLKSLLSRLAIRLHGHIGIISGRPVSELRNFLGPVPLAFAGSHGVEIRWPDGTVSEPEPATNLDAIANELDRLREAAAGIFIERKPFGVAVHYRNAPEEEERCRKLATALAHSTGLTLQTGKMVFELRMPGVDKGGALRTLAGSPAMSGTRPIFVGDDDTDEAGFIAAAELGGAGILVGAARPTAAHYRLDDVAATLRWLDTACGDVS
jgi:trehalose 6-phosphate phosphatase